MRKLIFVVLALVTLLGSAPRAESSEHLRVVTTLSTFADLVETVGGEHVKVSSIASPRFNPHFIEPKPSDVLKVKRADLFVHAGLDLEMWRYSLVDAAGKPELRPGGARELDLSQGIRLLEVPERKLTRAQGDIHLYGNPHYWLHPENAKAMVKTIADKLTEVDSAHADTYEQNSTNFLRQLDERMVQWRQASATIRGQEAVAYHNAWPYLTQFMDVRIEQFLEPKPGIPPTLRQLSFLEGHIKKHEIQVIVQSSYFSKANSESLAKRTGAKVVTLCHNVREVPECSDYLAMLEYNVNRLVESLKP
jgi:ABC-type Zn uptake system ZnuABC Zn-binding protein ZnuA